MVLDYWWGSLATFAKLADIKLTNACIMYGLTIDIIIPPCSPTPSQVSGVGHIIHMPRLQYLGPWAWGGASGAHKNYFDLFCLGEAFLPLDRTLVMWYNASIAICLLSQ